MTAAAPPPEAVLAAMAEAGFNVTHVYGLTEVYGPAVVNEWHGAWDALPPTASAALKARQGVRYPALEDLAVMDPKTMTPVPADGADAGRGHVPRQHRHEGLSQEPHATEEAFAGGWFHSGDLGVLHPDGYIQLKDRSKDIIISGGENISSIEVEDVLYKHPAVAACAVVGRPDEKWGETPVAFVELKPGAGTDGGGHPRLVPRPPRPLQMPPPRRVRRGTQDQHRQDPEVRAARAGEGGLRTVGRNRRSCISRRSSNWTHRRNTANAYWRPTDQDRHQALSRRSWAITPLADPRSGESPMIEPLNFISLLITLYVYIIIAGAIMSWLIAFNVVNPYNQFVRSIWQGLNALTEPLLRPIRRRHARSWRHRHLARHSDHCLLVRAGRRLAQPG